MITKICKRTVWEIPAITRIFVRVIARKNYWSELLLGNTCANARLNPSNYPVKVLNNFSCESYSTAAIIESVQNHMAVHFFAFIGGIVIGHQHYEHWHHASVGQKKSMTTFRVQNTQNGTNSRSREPLVV